MHESIIVNELISLENKSRSLEDAITQTSKPFKSGLDLISEDYKEYIISSKTISKICLKYRLTIEDLTHFEKSIPDQAWDTISNLEKDYKVRFNEFKVIKEVKDFFSFLNRKRVILLLKLSDDQYFVTYQWGEKISTFRKILGWTLHSLERQTVLAALLSLCCVVIYGLSQYLLTEISYPVINLFLITIAVTSSTTLGWLFLCLVLKIRPSTITWNEKYKS